MRQPLYSRLYFQVLTGIVLGVLVGVLRPEFGAAMRPLGDGFIKLIRMIIAPVIFCTVVAGIATMGDIKDLGRIGIKTLLYFEVITTPLALSSPWSWSTCCGRGPASTPTPRRSMPLRWPPTHPARSSSRPWEFILNIIPTTLVDAFARGEILQVLLVSVLFGLALLYLGDQGRPLVGLLDQFSQALFGVVGLIMRVAPIGAFGAMAFTIGTYGIATLLSLGKLMAGFYLACLLFVFVGMGTIARVCGFSLWKFIRYIKEEILIVLGTASSESVLPRLMVKLETLGCARRVVGLVVPTGYSMNLDGTSIYMAMARDIRRAGDEHAVPAGAAAGPARRVAADLKRRRGSHRERVRHARGHVVGPPDAAGGRPDTARRDRSFHVRSPGDYQFDWQRARGGRGRAMGGRADRAGLDARSEQRDRTRGRRAGSGAGRGTVRRRRGALGLN